MSSSETLYWHDYETFGANPSHDRPVQFAGQRTDLDLNPIGEPLVIYARPARDYLPHPEACLVTGILPQEAEEKGLCEADFIRRINDEFQVPGTCALGYNSLRFDDTVTRFTLYRNLRDPYAREYGDGRSRWDLIDAMRTAYALRPDGIEWPTRDDGLPSFRLEDLTAANGLDHGQAHDALADVHATIALAGLLKERQPKLFQWLYDHRRKDRVLSLIDIESREAMLHVSGRFGAARANLGLVLPLAWHPKNRNELYCADLSCDATLLLDLPAEELHRRLFTPGAELGADETRPGLKSVHMNRCPVLLPAKMADENAANRASLNLVETRRNLDILREHERKHPGALRDRLHRLSELDTPRPAGDPDHGLYSGGFIPRSDRSQLDRLLNLEPEELAASTVFFEDPRLEEMLFRYRARNYPETLDADEQSRWEAYRFERLSDGDGVGLTLDTFHEIIDGRLASAQTDERSRSLLERLQEWGDGLLA